MKRGAAYTALKMVFLPYTETRMNYLVCGVRGSDSSLDLCCADLFFVFWVRAVLATSWALVRTNTKPGHAHLNKHIPETRTMLSLRGREAAGETVSVSKDAQGVAAYCKGKARTYGKEGLIHLFFISELCKL